MIQGASRAVCWMVAILLWMSACHSNGERSTGPQAQAGVPGEDEIDMLRARLEAARAALPGAPAHRREELRRALERAEAALARYERLAAQGKRREHAQGVIYLAGATLVVNDATLAGVADDALLPFLLLGYVAVTLATPRPASSNVLAQAWSDATRAAADVGRIASAEAALMMAEIPPRNDCDAHFSLCLGTRLGKRNSGGTWGQSICYDCLNMCKGGSSWPDSTGHGKDCRWWNYR